MSPFTFKNLSDQVENYDGQYRDDVVDGSYFGFPIEAVLNAETRLTSSTTPSVAYFSMEYGLAPSI